MSSRALVWNQPERALSVTAGWLLRPLQLALAFPSVLYVGAMAVFLFRPPDLHALYADRVALAALVFFVVLRSLALRQRIPFAASVSLPMLGLTALAVTRALREPFDAQIWSIIASKYIVPFTLFHLAILIFRSSSELRHLEIFLLLALGYLTFIAVAFLADAPSLIFPRFILDASMGFHPDRARGPFLQAVANGLSLNLLGILALVFSRKRKAILLLLWLALPVAVLATMTRAVWIAFTVSSLAAGYYLFQQSRRILIVLVAIGLIVGLIAGLNSSSLKNVISDRTEERGPVEARLAVYEAGLEMFKERPFSGWPAGGMHAELARRMSGYHLRIFYVHNTYLALLVEFGVPGLALYTILFVNLFRLSRWKVSGERDPILTLRRVWPILLAVYLFNAFFVDMAYQFVIGLLFTVAGLLCARQDASGASA